MAVQVVPQEEIINNAGMFSGIGETIGWFIHYWWAWLLLLVLIIVTALLYYVYKKLDDERRQRDDVVYLRYKNLVFSCEDNARKKWMRSYWNPMSLLLLPILVIGWAFIPFIRKEASAKIRNIDGDFIGWYLGHTYQDNGVYALMYYTRKSWIFFKIPQILMIPTIIASSKIDEATGKEVLTYNKIKPYRIDEYTGDHDLNIKDVVKRGQYYYFPVLLTKDHEPISLSSTIMTDLQKYTGYEILENLVTDFSSSMRSAVQINSDVRKAQLENETPKEVEEEK